MAEKKFLYKVYNKNGEFIKSWDDVVNDPDFSWNINEGLGELTVRLPRTFDVFGESDDVAVGNEVQVWCDRGGTKNTLEVEQLNYTTGSIGWGTTSQERIAQTFQPTHDYKLSRVTLWTVRNGSPHDNIEMELWAGDSNNPTYKMANAQNRILGSLQPTQNIKTADMHFDFGKIQLYSGQTYWLIMTRDGGLDNTNYYALLASFNATDNYLRGGAKKYTTAAGWSDYLTNSDFCFKIYSGEDDVKKIYSGYISAYEPVIQGRDEYVDVHCLGYGSQLNNEIHKSGNSTTVAYNSCTIASIVKTMMDDFKQYNFKVSYGDLYRFLEDTNTVVSYTFNTQTHKQVIDKCREMAPANWYWRVGADNILEFKQKNSEADHYFTIGKDIISIRQNKRIEDLYNVVYFKGKDTLYRVYTRSGSIANYGRRAYMMQDERVTLDATADVMANSFLDEHDAIETRVEVDILGQTESGGLGYDIESIYPGQTCQIRNFNTEASESLWDQALWDVNVWDYDISYLLGTVLQIKSVKYTPGKATISLSSRPLPVASTMENIYRNLEGYRNAENPATPTAA